MKILSHAAALIGSAAIGYTGVSLIQQASGTGSGGTTDATHRPAPTATSPLSPELPAATQTSGSALAAQIRTALILQGIDPEWADDLAAGDASGFPALLEKLSSVSGSQKATLTSILLARWASLDPLGGAAFLKFKKDDENLSALFREWSQIDFGTAAATATEYGDKCIRCTLREKARLDPAGFLTWAKDHPGINPLALLNSGPGENSEALQRLAELDPDRMLAWSKLVPEDQWNEDFPNTFAAQLAKRSPEEAIAWAKTLANPTHSQAALCGIAGALATTQPDRALTLLAELPAESDYEIRGLYPAILGKLNLADPEKALDVAKIFPPGDIRNEILSRTMTVLLKQDPARAFEISEALGPEASAALSSNLLSITKDPDQARRILEAAPAAGETSFQREATRAALLVWLQSDPASLGVYLKDRMETPLLNGLKAELQKGMALLALQTGQPTEAGLMAAVGIDPTFTVEALLETDPARAAVALEQVHDAASRKQTAGDLATAWAARDRGDALEWATTLTEPAEQAAVWQAITGHWLGEDSHRASEWITTLPPGAGRDAAVLTMARHIQDTDPDLSWKWALTLSDSTVKTNALQEVASQWSRRDAAAARSALENSGLTLEERRNILETPPQPSAK